MHSLSVDSVCQGLKKCDMEEPPQLSEDRKDQQSYRESQSEGYFYEKDLSYKRIVFESEPMRTPHREIFSELRKHS